LFPVATDREEGESIEEGVKQDPVALVEATQPDPDLLNALEKHLPEPRVNGRLIQERPAHEGQSKEGDEDGEPEQGRPVEHINDQAASPAGLFNW
jgi:hypothetical protein